MIKIGILTYHRSCNYGAHLQALSLCSRLNLEKNLTAEIIDYRTRIEEYLNSEESWSLKKKIRHFQSYLFSKKLYKSFEKGIEKMPLSSWKIVSDDISELQKKVKNRYDIIIAGSDEIWKIDSARGFPTAYWLIGDFGCKKFSYAASSRSDFSKLSDKNYKVFVEAINEFDVVSVRDEKTYDEINKVLDDKTKLFMSCDPSFLYDFNLSGTYIEDKLIGKYKLDRNKKNVVVMIEEDEIAECIRRQLGKEYNLISLYRWHKGYHNIPDLEPLQWLDTIASSNLVITSFFHGVCFSIKNNVPFIAIGTASKLDKIKFIKKYESLSNCLFEMNELKKINWKECVHKRMQSVNYNNIVNDINKDFEIYIRRLSNSNE